MCDYFSPGTLHDICGVLLSSDNPAGLFVNRAILVLFAAALVDLAFAVLRIGVNWLFLLIASRRLRRLGADEQLPASLDDALRRLGLRSLGRWTLIGQRVRNLFALRGNNAVSMSVVKEITGERVSLHAGFSRFVAGTLTVIGLIGTVLGLTTAMEKLPQLAEVVRETNRLGPFISHLVSVLGGMKTAFSCTLAGLSTSIVLSVLNFFVQRLEAALYVRLETFSNYRLVPSIVKLSMDQATEEFVHQLDGAATRVNEILDRVDIAGQRYADGVDAVNQAAQSINSAAGDVASAATSVEGATQQMFEAAERVKEGGELFVAAVQTASASQREELEQWRTLSERVGAATDHLGEQVTQLAAATAALQTGADSLSAIQNLPERLEGILTEAMNRAVEAAQHRQNEATGEYLSRLEQFQQSYVDLVLGVQQTVDQLTRHSVEQLQQNVAGTVNKQDDILSELRTLNRHLGSDPVVRELQELRRSLEGRGGSGQASSWTRWGGGSARGNDGHATYGSAAGGDGRGQADWSQAYRATGQHGSADGAAGEQFAAAGDGANSARGKASPKSESKYDDYDGYTTRPEANRTGAGAQADSRGAGGGQDPNSGQGSGAGFGQQPRSGSGAAYGRTTGAGAQGPKSGQGAAGSDKSGRWWRRS